MENELPLLGVLLAMVSAAWFGFTFLYFGSFLRKHNIANFSSYQFLSFLLRGDIKSFYAAFFRARNELGTSRIITKLLIGSHFLSFALFFIGPLVSTLSV